MLAWADLGERFENVSAYETLKYSVSELLQHGDLVFLTAFGPEGCVIFDILSKLFEDGIIREEDLLTSLEELEEYNLVKAHRDKISQSNSPRKTKGRFIIANLDTGYQFKETLELKSALEDKYKLPVLMIEPKLSVAEQDINYGKDLFKADPDQCCYMRKLVPLTSLLSGRLAWITSIRREQTAVRARAKAFEFDKKFKLGKINPLIHWTKSDIWKYIHENKIPYNVLMDHGYDSIGCEPCTSKGEERQGRWAGKDKIECGLHLQDSDMEQGGEFVI
jgi:phosphoadenosine phosphosulfate reductase